MPEETALHQHLNQYWWLCLLLAGYLVYKFIRLVGYVRRLAVAAEKQAKAWETISDKVDDINISDILQRIDFNQTMSRVSTGASNAFQRGNGPPDARPAGPSH